MKRFFYNLYCYLAGRLPGKQIRPREVGRPEELVDMHFIEHEGQSIMLLDGQDLKDHIYSEIIEGLEPGDRAEIVIGIKSVPTSEMENAYEFDGY